MPETSSLVGAWLLTYLVHSTIIIGVVWAVSRWLTKRPEMTDTLWKVALVGGIVTASLQVGLDVRPVGGHLAALAPSGSAGDAALARAPSEATAPTDATMPSGATAPSEPTTAREGRAPREAMASSEVVPPAVAGGHAAGRTARPKRSAALTPLEALRESDPSAARRTARRARGQTEPTLDPGRALGAVERQPASEQGAFWNATEIAVLAWAAIAALLVLVFLRSWLQLHRRLRGRRDVVAGPFATALERVKCRGGVRAPIRLTASDQIDVSIALGVARPEICVPERALHALEPDQVETLIAHETAHLVRRDPSWRLISRLVRSALFIQPLNRIATRRLDATSEILCDDWAVGATERPLALARCLTRVAGWVALPRLPASVPAMAGKGSGLRERVRRLVAEDQPRGRRASRWLVPGVVAALAAITMAAPGASAAADRSQPETRADDVASPFGCPAGVAECALLGSSDGGLAPAPARPTAPALAIGSSRDGDDENAADIDDDDFDVDNYGNGDDDGFDITFDIGGDCDVIILNGKEIPLPDDWGDWHQWRDLAEGVLDDVDIPDLEDLDIPDVEDLDIPDIPDVPDLDIPDLEDLLDDADIPDLEDLDIPDLGDLLDDADVALPAGRFYFGDADDDHDDDADAADGDDDDADAAADDELHFDFDIDIEIDPDDAPAVAAAKRRALHAAKKAIERARRQAVKARKRAAKARKRAMKRTRKQMRRHRFRFRARGKDAAELERKWQEKQQKLQKKLRKWQEKHQEWQEKQQEWQEKHQEWQEKQQEWQEKQQEKQQEWSRHYQQRMEEYRQQMEGQRERMEQRRQQLEEQRQRMEEQRQRMEERRQRMEDRKHRQHQRQSPQPQDPPRAPQHPRSPASYAPMSGDHYI